MKTILDNLFRCAAAGTVLAAATTAGAATILLKAATFIIEYNATAEDIGVQAFLDSEGWQVMAVEVRLRKPIADQLGASRNIFRAGSLEIPVNLIQSVGDAVVLSVRVEGLRAVLPPGDESAPAH